MHSIAPLHPMAHSAAVLRAALVAVALGLLALAAPSRAAVPEGRAGPPLEEEVEEFDNEDCLDCHEGDEEEEEEIGVELFEASVHGDNACIDCHADATPEHDDEDEELAPPVCVECHEDRVDEYATGIHGTLFAEGDEDAPGCAFCHGSHGILSRDDPSSPTFPLNVPTLCGECHQQNGRSALRENATQTHIVRNYTMSIHGKGLLESGLIVSATCSSCHTAHMELPAKDPRSSVNRANIVKTCASCHHGISDKLATSIHSPEVTETEETLPACNDCHTSHTIKRVEWTDFRFEIITQCGDCHDELIATYFDTYHGKVSKLGGKLTARCYDCHGSHEILPASDPASMLHADNKVATCAACHPNANENFVQYLPHATHDDPERYASLYYSYWFMTWLLIGTIGFFGIHTALWLIRSLIARNGERRKPEEVDPETALRYYRRFQPIHTVLHLMVIVSFLSLAFTGMTLKYPDTPFFAASTRLLGGPEVTGLIHRLGALVTFAYFGIHLAQLTAKLRRREITLPGLLKEEYSLVPLWRDAKELGRNFLWFFGLGAKPKFGRWTYWEKFDYMAVFWGVSVIGLSGLIMWFPESATVLVPGWIINVATIIHSDEALLAAAFIFTVHFFNTHFRPEKFPMDPVIFTGRVPLEDFKREHPREFERLAKSGEIKDHLIGPPPRWLAVGAYSLGLTFLTVGLGIIAAVVYSILFV